MTLASAPTLRQLLQPRPLVELADRLTAWGDSIVLLDSGGAKLAAALTLASVAVLVMLLRRLLQKKIPGVLVCGACDGVLHDRKDPACPHCGEALREVGRFIEGERLGPATRAFIIAWLLCAPLPALLLMRGMLAVAPQRRVPVYSCELTARNSTGIVRVHLHLGDHRPGQRGGPAMYHVMVMDFRAADRSRRGQTLPPVYVTVRYRLDRNAGRTIATLDDQPQPVDAARLLTRLKVLQLDVFHSHVVEQAEELVRVIDVAPAAGVASINLAAFRLTAQSAGDLTETPAWYIVLTLAVGLGLWIAPATAYGLRRREG